MTPQQRTVTRDDVEELWKTVFDSATPSSAIVDRAQELLELVSSESPVVNWALTEIYHLHRVSEPPTAERDSAHGRWLTNLASYDADPQAWMVAYFQSMVTSFGRRFGVDRAKTLGLKMEQRGQLTGAELDDALAAISTKQRTG